MPNSPIRNRAGALPPPPVSANKIVRGAPLQTVIAAEAQPTPVQQNGGGAAVPPGAGWSPQFAVVTDGARRVLQVTSWTGGTGAPPASPVYVAAAGFTTNIALAIDIRGAAGANGTNGTNGTNGATWYSGAGAPGGGLGVDGDFYFRTSNDDVYLKSAGTWSVIANIRGATGATGGPGPPGPSDYFSITAYGAVINSTGSAATNDAAIAAAIAAAVAVGGGTVFFPSGTWYISAVIARSGTQSVSFLGAGTQATTILQLSVNTGVFNCASSQQDTCYSFRHMTVGHHCADPNANSSASMIKVVNTDLPANKRGPNCVVESLCVFSDFSATVARSFAKYFELDGCWNSSFKTIVGFGPSNIGTIFYLGGAQPNIGVNISDVGFSSANKVCEMTDEEQGITFTSCAFAAMNSGWYVSGTQVDQLTITGCHCNLNGSTGGLNSIIEGKILQGTFTGNNFYGKTSTTFIKGALTECAIVGNVLGPGDTTQTNMRGIDLTTGYAVAISGNTFYRNAGNPWDELINFDGATSNCKASGNTWDKGTPPTSVATDSGTNNTIGEAQGKQVSVAIGAGLADLGVDVSIAEMGFGRKPAAGSCFPSQFFTPTPMVAVYDYANGATTKTNARIHLYMTDGTNLPNVTRDFNLTLTP